MIDEALKTEEPETNHSRRRHFHEERLRRRERRATQRLTSNEPSDTLARAPQPHTPHRRLLVCESNGHFLDHIEPEQIDEMIATKGQFVWLDLKNPTDADLAMLKQEFHFHPLAMEDATRHFERPKIDTYDNYYFLVFYAVHTDTEGSGLVTQALHLFIGANFLVSIHAAEMPAVNRTLTRWQQREEQFGNDPAALVYALLDTIVDDYFPVIDALADRVDDIEERMFARFETGVQQEIFGLKRDLLAMRRVVAPERDLLNVLIRRETPVFQAGTIVYLQDVYDHVMRVTDSIDTYRDMLSSALDVFLSLQSNQLNQILKVLTVTSIVLMSVTLVAGIYGMNFRYMPELEWRYGYPFALGLMVAIALGLLVLFRRLRWL